MYPNLYSVKFERIPGVMDESVLEALKFFCCRTELPGVDAPLLVMKWWTEFVIDERMLSYRTFWNWATKHTNETGAADIKLFDTNGNVIYDMHLEDIQFESMTSVDLDWTATESAKFSVYFKARFKKEEE